MKRALLSGLFVLMVLAGCGGSPPAPVIERTPGRAPAAPVAAAPVIVPSAPPMQPDIYTVRRGDTLYSIALDKGLDYRELAAWNAISDPNVVQEGYVLALKPPASQVQVRPITTPNGVDVRPITTPNGVNVHPLTGAQTAGPRPLAPGDLVTEPKAVKLPYSDSNLALLSRPAAPGAASAQPAPPAAIQPQRRSEPKPEPAMPEERAKPVPGEDSVDWSWPASGKVLAGFSDPTSKGVDIAGKKGEPVNASAGGRVVYIGEGLRGYGKLVIIKHNNTFLSAYAHNDAILVKEGQTVVKGQKIAEIGSTGTDQTKLHFEIRQLGKPVDPLRFLPERRQ